MRKIDSHRIYAVLALFAASAHVAAAESATMTGGWEASLSPSIQQSANRSAFVFQLEGSYKLTTASKGDTYFLLKCVGLDVVTQVNTNESSATGTGRCELKGKSGEKLLAAMETTADGFTLHIDGGTGKWAQASGRLVSKETFTVESATLLKAYSNMQGEITFPK